MRGSLTHVIFVVALISAFAIGDQLLSVMSLYDDLPPTLLTATF